jgi:hypothetical protein
MKFIKGTAMALIAGAGLALVASQALAQNSSSTDTSSINGNADTVDVGAGISSTQIDATHTSGNAIAAAIATPIFTASGGASFGQGGTFSGTGPQTQGPNIDPVPGGPNPNQVALPGQLGNVLNGGSFNGSIDASESDTFALNHVALWIHASESEVQGSATTSSTTSAGVSVAGLFVFGQTTAVGPGGTLTDQVPNPPSVSIASDSLDNNNGSVALNLVAGVGNQQGNNLSTLLEVSGAGGTTAGSNSVNVEGNQTIADAGLITDAATLGGGNETATIATDSLDTNAGAVAVNVGAGVGNQQVNNITLAH